MAGDLALQDRPRKVDRDGGGELRHRHLGDLLGGDHDIEGGADPAACLDQQGKPPLSSVAIGDVEGVLAHPEHVSVGVLEPVVGAGPEVDRQRVAGRPTLEMQIQKGFTRVQYMTHDSVERGRMSLGQERSVGVQLIGPQAAELGERSSDLLFVRRVAPGQAQIGAVDGQAEG